jgi:hypothetical protein
MIGMKIVYLPCLRLNSWRLKSDIGFSTEAEIKPRDLTMACMEICLADSKGKKHRCLASFILFKT